MTPKQSPSTDTTHESAETSGIRPRLEPGSAQFRRATPFPGTATGEMRVRVDGKGRWDRTEPMDRRHGTQKRKLLEAAAELLAEAGISALSVEQVTERAQVGRRTFYVHFEGRAQLLLALHSELAIPLFASLDEASRAEASAIAVVHRTFEHLFDYILQSPLCAQFVLVDAPLLGERHAEITQRFFDALSSLLVVGTHRETPHAALSAHEAQILVLGARGAALSIAEGRRDAEFPELAQSFQNLLTRLLDRGKR